MKVFYTIESGLLVLLIISSRCHTSADAQHFSEGKQCYSCYWFGKLRGAGRGGDLSDANGMWLGRYQWNLSGRVLEFLI